MRSGGPYTTGITSSVVVVTRDEVVGKYKSVLTEVFFSLAWNTSVYNFVTMYSES